MTDLDFKGFDCDHHYYEAEDAFTRHLDPLMATRAMQRVSVNEKTRHMVGGRLTRLIPKQPIDPSSIVIIDS